MEEYNQLLIEIRKLGHIDYANFVENADVRIRYKIMTMKRFLNAVKTIKKK